MNTDTAHLWTAMANGSEQARDELLNHHIGLVYHVARQLSRSVGSSIELDEMVSAGTLGLISALQGFDTSRNLAFSTYAAPRIRGAILDELRAQDIVPRSMRRKARDLSHARETLQHRLGRVPEAEEIAEELQIDMETVWKWEADVESTIHISLDHHDSEQSSEDSTPADRFVDENAEDPDNVLNHEQEVELLSAAMLKISERERTVLALLYFEQLKLHEISAILGLTESRISQIRFAALGKLRRELAPIRRAIA